MVSEFKFASGKEGRSGKSDLQFKLRGRALRRRVQHHQDPVGIFCPGIDERILSLAREQRDEFPICGERRFRVSQLNKAPGSVEQRVGIVFLRFNNRSVVGRIDRQVEVLRWCR